MISGDLCVPLEKGLWNVECPDDRIRKVREISECVNNALPGCGPNLIENYVQRKMNIYAICVDMCAREYGVILEAAPHAYELESVSEGVGGERDHIRKRLHGDQALMLPQYVHIVKCDEKPIASTPRLETRNDILIRIRKLAYHLTALVIQPQKVGLSFGQGEVSVLKIRNAMSRCDTGDENVQTAPDAVKDSADFCADDGGRLFDVRQINDLLLHLRACLNPEAVRWEVTPGFDPSFERVYLGCGPFDAGLSV